MTVVGVLALVGAAVVLGVGALVREREVPSAGVARRSRAAGALGLTAVALTAVAVAAMVTTMLVTAL